jgi:hypothetical protein
MKTKNIRKTFLWSDIVILLAILAIGVVLLLLGSGWKELGYVVIACDVCMIPFCLHGYKIAGESGTFREESIAVSRDDQEAILAFLKGENNTLDIQFNEQGGALISVYYQKEKDVFYAQYYDYVQMMEGVKFSLLKISPDQREKLLQVCRC